MVDKIEFSDLYKFSASIGIILIVLAFIVPWFINHDVSFVMMKYSDVHELTASGKAIITQQQNALEFMNKYILFLSGGLLVVGGKLLFWSINKWKNRQDVLDSIQNEELRAKRFQNLTIDEKREQIAEENNIEEPTIETTPTTDSKRELSEIEENIKEAHNKTIAKILDIENRLFLKISVNTSDKYLPLQNVRVGDIEYDIILQSKFKQLKDRLIEIRFFGEKLSKNNFSTSIHKTYLSKLSYEKQTGRVGIGVLITVLQNEGWNENKLLIESWFEGHLLSQKIKLILLNETEIETMDIVKNGVISKFRNF